MKKFWIFVFTLCLLIVPHSWAGDIERIQEKGEITVSLNQGYPPFAMKKDRKLFGLDVDLANLMADYLGVKVRFIQPESYDQQIPKLLSGESDIIIAAMTRTVRRGLQVNFTKPYYEVSQAALVDRKLIGPQTSSYFDLTDIPDLTLGVKARTTHETFARKLFPAGAIKTYPTAAEAAEALTRGEVNAMVADSPFVRVWRSTHPKQYDRIRALLEPVTRETYGFAIRRGDADFLNWLNLFIDQVTADGTLALLKYEYFERMSWAGAQYAQTMMPTRAELLKNRFLDKRKKQIERLRRQLPLQGDAYE